MQYIHIHTGFSIALPITWWTILISIAIAVIGITIIYLLDKFVFKHKTHDGMKVEKDKTQKTSILMIVGIVISVVMFIINVALSF